MTTQARLDELVEVLGRWQNQQVAVRVVADGDELIAVFAGTLRALSVEKHPSLFWPVEPANAATGGIERPGIYAHLEQLTDVRVHVGGSVVEYTQAGVTVNLRRLEARAEV